MPKAGVFVPAIVVGMSVWGDAGQLLCRLAYAVESGTWDGICGKVKGGEYESYCFCPTAATL